MITNMAPSSSFSFCCIMNQFLLVSPTVIAVICLLFASEPAKAAATMTLPFHPRDVLPLLPNRVARPIMNSLNSAVDLLPDFVGAATADPHKVPEWSGPCFRKNSAWLDLRDDSGTLHIKVSDATSWTCIDLYVFATPYQVSWDWYFLAKEHTLEFKLWHGRDEYEYVKKNGIAVFLMPAGVVGTLQASMDVIPLFINNEEGEKANLEFLQKNMKTNFQLRPQASWVSNVNPNDIQSGDFLALSKIRGSSGAFETLEKWVTGAYAGHAAGCIRDPHGNLWVAESGRTNDKGEEIVELVRWEEWWEFERNKDGANPHIALLRLNKGMRSKFNNTAAWEYVNSMNGKPYGFHNVIFSWIDTADGNYPSPVDAHLVAAAMTIWNALKPASATNLWNEALNLRLGTQGLDFPEILVEGEKKGLSFDKLLAIAEDDNWKYDNGKSVSCVALVVEMYKSAGLFGSLTSSVQATEFTVRDGYTLKFYENNQNWQPKWCNEGDTVKMPYCQILGNYRMELPQYNTIHPYNNMNQKCPSLPPNYDRPNTC